MERASEEEQNGINLSFVASSSEETAPLHLCVCAYQYQDVWLHE